MLPRPLNGQQNFPKAFHCLEKKFIAVLLSLKVPEYLFNIISCFLYNFQCLLTVKELLRYQINWIYIKNSINIFIKIVFSQ